MAKQETVERWAAEAGVDLEKVRFDGGNPVVWHSCGRCGGTGIFQWWTAGGPASGVCFGCGGGKGNWVGLQGLAARERGRERKARRAAAERETEARRAVASARAFLAEHAGLAAALRADRGADILRSFASQLARRGRLTDRQVEVAFEMASRPPKPAEPDLVPVEEGRHTVAGKVLTVKEQSSRFGFQLKMLVLVTTEAGTAFKAWGTVPAAIDTVERGQEVVFTATFERSKDDPTFGFFKRPTQATAVFPAE